VGFTLVFQYSVMGDWCCC